MKPVLVFAVVVSMTGVSLAQTTPAAGTQATAPVVKTMRRVMAPPADKMPSLKTRPSTAESGSLHTSKPPLHELPAFHAAAPASHARTNASASAPADPMQRTGHWLLVYRTEHCIPCDRLMNALATSQSGDLRNGTPYTIIVGSPSPNAIESVRSSFGALQAANWLPDSDHSIFKSLQLKGYPEVFAMDGNRIAWKVAGNLGDPQAVLRMTDTWIAGSGAAADAAKVAAAAKASKAEQTPAASSATKATSTKH